MTALMSEHHLQHPRSRAAFHTVQLLVAAYVGLSLFTLAAIVLLRDHSSLVNAAVWIRGTLVAASALLTLSFTVRMARGSRRAHRRLRIISVVMVVAIAVIIALPGTFPLWLKVEQGVCGLLLIGVAAMVNGRHLRSAFASHS